MTTTQTQETQKVEEEVFVRIFRDSKNENNWAIVRFGQMIKINRKTGLELHNKYCMNPFPFGYEGFIPKSELTEVLN